MKVDSLLQREGRGPVERTGPIPLPGRRPRHLAAGPRGRPAHPDAVTEPLRIPSRPGAAFAVPSGAFPVPADARRPVVGPSPAVPRERDPRPTPAVGIPIGPALQRERDARPAPPRRAGDGPPAVRRVTGPGDPGIVVPDTPPLRADPALRPRGRLRGRRGRGRTAVVVVLVLVALALGAVAAWFASGSGALGLGGGTGTCVTTGVRPAVRSS